MEDGLYRCEDVEEGLMMPRCGGGVIAAQMWRMGYSCGDVEDGL